MPISMSVWISHDHNYDRYFAPLREHLEYYAIKTDIDEGAIL